MTCDCPAAGFCARYQRQQTQLMWQTCRGERLTPEKCEAYRKLWAGEVQSVTSNVIEKPLLTNQEVRELFGEIDRTLLGNRIAELTSAIGIPACSGCNTRRIWLNKAHQWLKDSLARLG